MDTNEYPIKLDKEESELFAICKKVAPWDEKPVQPLREFAGEHYPHIDPQSEDALWMLFLKLLRLFRKVGPVEYDMDTQITDLFRTAIKGDALYLVEYPGSSNLESLVADLRSKLRLMKMRETFGNEYPPTDLFEFHPDIVEKYEHIK